MKTMKKILKYMLLLLLCVPTACTDDPADSEPWQLKAGEGKVVMRFYAQFPEAHAAVTRTWADEPVYENLDLYCVVFDDGGHPSRNYLTQVKPAKCYPDKKSQTEINGTKVDIIPFEVELDAISEENAIIHFIAIDKDIADVDNPLLQKDNLYGPENVVIPRMTVSGGHDAYWQRIALGFPIKIDNAPAIANFVSKTSPVPLIRNFAKISVTWEPDPSKGQPEDFELMGFCVINTLDRGTIAPYSELLPDGFPQFVDFENGRRPYNYDEIVDAKLGQGYTGVRATGSRVQNPGMVPADTNDGSSPYTLTQKYVYERPFSETNHTYIIVKGLYKKGEAQAPTYYKLDIGSSQKEYGVFEFSNLLRNFDFHIRITAVSADGYATTEDAAKGLIYNNNISAALETQHLLSISNGYHMMYVNFTSYVIVRQEDAIELLYRYFDLGSNPDQAGMAGSVQIKGKVKCLELEKDGTANGDVIESVTKGPERKEEIMQGTTKVTREWENLQIKTKVPGPVLKYQTLTLYYENGLSRTIKFYMQEPWTLENAVTYGAQLDHREEEPDPNTPAGQYPNHISRHAGENLTIFFQLPPALPKAMFPLEFVIESNRQNIENDKVGTIAVRSGASMFEESSGEIRIQYVKTVRWEEYDPDNDLHETDPESTDDNYAPNPDYPDKSNEQYIYVGDRVRCRFLTITDLSDGAITQDVTTVRIRNKYFNDLDIVFYRDLENPEKRPGE